MEVNSWKLKTSNHKLVQGMDEQKFVGKINVKCKFHIALKWVHLQGNEISNSQHNEHNWNNILEIVDRCKHMFWVWNNQGLQITIVARLKQLHYIIKHVHYCHHGKYSLVVGLGFVVLFGECLRVWLGLSTQPIWL